MWCNFASQGDEVCGDGREFITRTLIGTWYSHQKMNLLKYRHGRRNSIYREIDALGNKIYRYDPGENQKDVKLTENQNQ